MVHAGDIYITSITLIKILAGLSFFFAYLESKRLSALFISIFWFLVIPTATFGRVDIRIENIMIALGYAFVILGIFQLIKEEHQFPLPKSIFILFPLMTALVGTVESIIRTTPQNGYVVAGIFELIVGLMTIEILGPYYGKNAKGLGISLALSGIMTPSYAIVTPEFANKLVILIIAWSLAISQFYFYYRIIYSERFFKWPQSIEAIEALRIEGLRLISPNEFIAIKEEIGIYPALAFLRNFKPAPGWICYRLSTIEAPNTIYPTDLYKITETAVRYFSEARQKNTKGITIIEGLEFLRLYNNFESVAKMLSAVRDHVIINNGTLVLVAEENAWEKKEWAMLKRILGEEVSVPNSWQPY
ncbi:DUF835 domain-containing protein [Thermococcus sp. EP1]|uniref:DUF835 domain-containing protein n=1 Tax=Thermococcus sp. EP1 TaxID=1591054 RepID=UPI0006DCECA5|nr:DUF835 domain-containing protein [Thermococcus sp. EP1]